MKGKRIISLMEVEKKRNYKRERERMKKIFWKEKEEKKICKK